MLNVMQGMKMKENEENRIEKAKAEAKTGRASKQIIMMNKMNALNENLCSLWTTDNQKNQINNIEWFEEHHLVSRMFKVCYYFVFVFFFFFFFIFIFGYY